MHAEEQYAIRVIKKGASGYLAKETIPNDLITAIRKAAIGKRYVSNKLGEKLIGTLAGDRDKPLHEKLSNREYQVSHMIARDQSIKEIAYHLEVDNVTTGGPYIGAFRMWEGYNSVAGLWKGLKDEFDGRYDGPAARFPSSLVPTATPLPSPHKRM